MSSNSPVSRKAEKAFDTPSSRTVNALKKRLIALATTGRGHAGQMLFSDAWRAIEGTELTGLLAHDLVTQGVRVEYAKLLMQSFHVIPENDLYLVLGITPRTMQRRAASAHKTLDSNASDRALRLTSITSQAMDVLGSQEAAERWLSTPAVWTSASRSICCRAPRARSSSRRC